METDVFAAAEEQHGVFHRSQAHAQRVNDRQLQHRVRMGRMYRELPGVYRVAGAPPTWSARLTAVARWVGPTAVFSHETAARLHGLEAFKEANEVHVITTRDLHGKKKQKRAGLTVHHTTGLWHRDVADLPECRVTSVPRTLLDLAATLDAPALEACVDDALSHRKVRLEQLTQMLERSGRRRGVRALRAVVEARMGKGLTESQLEAKGLEALKDAEMPLPTQQRNFRLGHGRARVDFIYERERVVVELDGYATHSSVKAFEADRQRDNALAARGFIVLRWTWNALEVRPEVLLAELASVLARRGP